MAQSSCAWDATRGSPDPFSLYCTTAANSFRYRAAPATRAEHVSIAETGYSRAVRTAPDAEPLLPPEQRFQTLYKASFLRHPVGSNASAIVGNALAPKPLSSFSKQNRFQYQHDQAKPPESIFATSFKPHDRVDLGQHSCASMATGLSGYTRNSTSANQPAAPIEGPIGDTEFCSAYRDPADIIAAANGTIECQSGARLLSGFSRSCQPPAASEWATDLTTTTKAAYKDPAALSPCINLQECPPQGEDLSGFVRNYSSGFDKHSDDKKSMKGGVWRRANQEGNIRLHKPHQRH